MGIGWPTDSAWVSESVPVRQVATDEDSVRPYALVVAFTLGNVSRILRCSSSADGDPPKLTEITDDVSYSWRAGCSHARQIIVGTVAQIITPSSWISSNAWIGSNRPTGITSRMPAIIPTTRVEWQPDTWNSGEVNSETG